MSIEPRHTALYAMAATDVEKVVKHLPRLTAKSFVVFIVFSFESAVGAYSARLNFLDQLETDVDRNGTDLILGRGIPGAGTAVLFCLLPHLARPRLGPGLVMSVLVLGVVVSFHRRTSLSDRDMDCKVFSGCGIGSIEENSTHLLPVPAMGEIWNCGFPQDIRASFTQQANRRSPGPMKYTGLLMDCASSVIVITKQ